MLHKRTLPLILVHRGLPEQHENDSHGTRKPVQGCLLDTFCKAVEAGLEADSTR